MEPVSRCEEEILLVVFELGAEKAALQPVSALVNKKFEHKWMPQTVYTFLARLVKKNILTMRRQGRYCYYTPTISLDEYRRQRMREMLDVVFDGDIQVLMNYLNDTE